MKTTFTLLVLFFFICAGTSFAQWSYSYDEYDSASVDSSSNLHATVQVDGTTYGSCYANGGTYTFPGCPAYHQSTVYNVLQNTTQGTSAGGNSEGPSYDMFDYISDQFDTGLFWNPGDDMTQFLEAYVYCTAAFAAIFDTTYLIITQSASCPGSLSLTPPVKQEILDNTYPTYLTGLGGIAQMTAGPCCAIYTGDTISESVSEIFPRGCPRTSTFDNQCGGGPPGTIGLGKTLKDGTSVPPTFNVIWDEHTSTSGVSVLDAAGIPGPCNIVCTQTYSCGGKNIGTFTITRQLSKGTDRGTPVTNVTVSKQ